MTRPTPDSDEAMVQRDPTDWASGDPEWVVPVEAREALAWQPIETAPRYGQLVLLKNENHPEWGEYRLGWNRRSHRWEGRAYTPLASVPIWWGREYEQPTHWKP